MTFIDSLEQGQVPILLSIDQTRNLRVTIDKITCKAFGMIRPIPVSSSGHAMFGLAAFCKQHDARMANTAVDDDQINPIAYPSLLAAAYPADAASKEPIVPAPAQAAETAETIGSHQQRTLDNQSHQQGAP